MKPGRHINEESLNGFRDLLVSVNSGNTDTYHNLITVSIEIVKTWCRHERIEPEWVAEDGKITNLDAIVKPLADRFADTNRGNDQVSFAGYKDYLIKMTCRLFEDCFAEFLDLMKKDDERAWRLVFYSLEKKSAQWFFKRTSSGSNGYHSVFCEAVELVYRNLLQKDLAFSNSRELKSYFFKILENKFLETGRDNFSRRSMPIDDVYNASFLVQHPVGQLEEEEDRAILLKALESLNQNEQHILTEHYFCERRLNDIAGELKLSEGNIRIMKHRALQKLSDYLTRLGYESQRGGGR